MSPALATIIAISVVVGLIVVVAVGIVRGVSSDVRWWE
jgi:hypothetical protein